MACWTASMKAVPGKASCTRAGRWKLHTHAPAKLEHSIAACTQPTTVWALLQACRQAALCSRPQSTVYSLSSFSFSLHPDTGETPATLFTYGFGGPVQVVPGGMWTFEQMQTLGLSSVATTVRMTVIKLASGGLWIHSPIAPTRQAGTWLQN